VVKADGLAAGKGVTVAATVEQAEAAIAALMEQGALGAAGASVVIEERLTGPEVSLFALCDGTDAIFLGAAQDHKRVGDGDTGPNTGGMGAYSPVPVFPACMAEAAMQAIIRPALTTMAARGTPYRGILFAGLILTDDGPKLIEFNVRFGDPECETLLPLLRSDILPVLVAATDGTLKHVDLRWKEAASATVIMCSKGYPGAYATGSEIYGLEEAGDLPNVTIFHAGTMSDQNGILANGGRVLAVNATGATLAEAVAQAYAAVDTIDWPDGFCRRDIGKKAIWAGLL
jgi:phosphoribosylamine--glycine ligase